MDLDVRSNAQNLTVVASEDQTSFRTLPNTLNTLYLERLPDHDIRLITILPSDDADAPIECELHQYEASQGLAYEALSYVWGDQNDLADVKCNALAVQITRNLRNALWRLRKRTEPRTIWADALWLNQLDNKEKSIHVPLMGRVYSQATQTVIYLGETSSVEASAAANSLLAVFRLVDDLRKQADIDENDELGIFNLLSEKLPDQPQLEISWHDVEQFFETAWFKRIWCVQEITLARNSGDDSYAIYGDVQIPYHVFSKAATCFVIATLTVNLDFFQGRYIAPHMSHTIDLSLVSRHDNYLLVTLVLFRDYLATDPRDKVYGLLGILHKKFRFNPLAITVDYSKSAAEVYTDTAIEILRMGQSLELLDYIRHPKAYDSDALHPSWVPRWDIRRFANRIHPEDTKAFRAIMSLDHSRMINDYRVARNQLLVHGLEYCCVARVSSSLSPIESEDLLKSSKFPIFESVFPEVWDRIQPSRSQCFDNRKEILAMARTFTTGTIEPLKHFRTANNQQENQFLADFLDFVHHILGSCSSICVGAPVNRKYTIDTDGTMCSGFRERYAFGVHIVCRGRNLFHTEYDTYGIGPDCMLKGDLIVGLFGASSPFALRPKNGGYIVLGPVYIDELMDGTYFKDLQTAGMKEKQFTLI